MVASWQTCTGTADACVEGGASQWRHHRARRARQRRNLHFAELHSGAAAMQADPGNGAAITLIDENARRP